MKKTVFFGVFLLSFCGRIFTKLDLSLSEKLDFCKKAADFDSFFSRFWLKIDSFCVASESKKAQKSEKAEFHNPTFPEQTNK